MLIPHESFQPAETYEEALGRAAKFWGIENEYTDTWGQRHVTTPEIQKAILNARGIGTAAKQDLDQALEDRLWREWSSMLEPVLVVSGQTRPREFALHVPANLADRSVSITIHWEEGKEHRSKYSLRELRTSGEAKLRGSAFLRKQTPLPGALPLGYHKLTVAITGPGRKVTSASTTLIVCPERAYTPPVLMDGYRAAGIALSLYGIRSQRNWGCGDFTDLEHLIDWAAEKVGCSFIGLNPLHALANRYPYNISPYLPVSVFYQNPIYLDVERIEDVQRSRRAQSFIRRPETQEAIHALREARYVDYGRVYDLKLCALKLGFLEFLREYRAGGSRSREFRHFVESEGERLDRFAVFCALDQWIHSRNPNIWIWPDWQEEYHDPESGATLAFAKKHWRLVLFFKYAQWQVDRQLAAAQKRAREHGMSIGLYQDLALATDRYGADFWAYRPFFISGATVGAPPDGFSPNGQDWSFPPPNFERHREDGYRLFVDSIRKNCRHGGALRFDHVMRFFRLYWIPKGKQPTHGAYVRERYQELLHILALESVRNKVILVGEDLGTVTPKIREALTHFGILGYKVPYFERTRHGQLRPPQDYPEQSLVSSSTHDLPTLAGFWLYKDIEAKRSAGLLSDDGAFHRLVAERRHERQQFLDLLHQLRLLPDWFPHNADHVPEFTGELHNAFAGLLATAHSRLMVLNQEDLFKETEQQNLPATTEQYPNWQHKMIFTVEELCSSQKAHDYTAMFRNWVERTGRGSRRARQEQAS